MNIKTQTNSSELKYPLFIGGLTIVGGLSYLIYTNYFSEQKIKQKISRDLIEKILKDFRKNFYPVFKEIRIMSTNIQAQIQAQTRSMTISDEHMEEIKMMIIENQTFKSMIEDIEDKVYKEQKIYERKDFESYVLQLSQKDKQINSLMTQMRQSYIKALNGQVETLEIEIPSEITPEMVFQIKKNMLKHEMNNYLQYCIQYETMNGRINPRDPQFALGMEENFKKSSNEFKLPENLNFNENYLPVTALSQALLKYTQKDKNFAQKVYQLQTFKQNILRQSIYSGNVSSMLFELDKIDEIGKEKEPLIREVEQEKDIEIESETIGKINEREEFLPDDKNIENLYQKEENQVDKDQENFLAEDLNDEKQTEMKIEEQNQEFEKQPNKQEENKEENPIVENYNKID